MCLVLIGLIFALFNVRVLIELRSLAAGCESYIILYKITENILCTIITDDNGLNTLCATNTCTDINMKTGNIGIQHGNAVSLLATSKRHLFVFY